MGETTGPFQGEEVWVRRGQAVEADQCASLKAELFQENTTTTQCMLPLGHPGAHWAASAGFLGILIPKIWNGDDRAAPEDIPAS